MKILEQRIGKLSEFHFVKEFRLFPFSLKNYSRDEEISYSRTLEIVRIGAKDQKKSEAQVQGYPLAIKGGALV